MFTPALVKHTRVGSNWVIGVKTLKSSDVKTRENTCILCKKQDKDADRHAGNAADLQFCFSYLLKQVFT